MTDLAVSGVAHGSVARRVARPAVSGPELRAEVLTGPAAYASLAEDWDGLASLQAGTTVFQSRELLTAWARTSARVCSLATVVVRSRSKPLLLLPLCIEQKWGVKVATGAGAPVAQYDEALFDPDREATAVFDEALRGLARTVKPDLLFLERVRADGPLRKALHGVSPISWMEGAPFADISEGVPALKENLKSRVVSQQKKRVRKFAEQGEAAFAVARDAEEARAWLAEAMTLKREWLKSTGRVSRAFMKDVTANCLSDLALTLSGPAASPRMVVSRLSLDGHTAAIEMGFCHRERYHLYLGSFAPQYAKFGPGNILTERVLEWCAENGIKRYDMLAPRSRNKSEWQSGDVPVLDFAIPLTAAGRFYKEAVLVRMSPALRNLFYALPVPVRTAIAASTLRL